MCRLLAYIGAPMTLDDLLYKPSNSLILQSFKAREREEPLNGDGFGVGWYAPEIERTPACYRNIRPAWNDRNLRSIAPKIRSGCFFAHVRAASWGSVTESNCHPFQWGEKLFMHNGHIAGFQTMRRALREPLSDDLYNAVEGTTDSEHVFAYFIERWRKLGATPTLEGYASALRETIRDIEAMSRSAGITEPSFMNFVVTDGRGIVATRYTSDRAQAPHTLYLSRATSFECEDGRYQITRDGGSVKAALIASEKLTEDAQDWEAITPHHLVTIDAELNVTSQAL